MRRIALLLALLLCATSLTSLTAQGSNRIIAIGDIHGSLDGFTAILKKTGLIDAKHKWAGGRTQLLQTGDYTDRGDGTRAVMDLLMALEPQAKDAGGRVVVLLGNHEVMNLIGETRDVTREIFATFADANSEKKRQQAWENYAKLAELKTEKGDPVPSVYAQTREAWLTTHPLGYAEYKEALSPRGKYGAWLRGKPMVAEAGGSIFMHAGINPANAPAKIEDLNLQLRDEIKRLDQFVERLIDAKLATREFSLQEILQVASAEIGLRQRDHLDGERGRHGGRSPAPERAAADGGAGDHEGGFVAGDQSRGGAVVSRSRHGHGRSVGRAVRDAAAGLWREALCHRPHAAAKPIDHHPFRRPRGVD